MHADYVNPLTPGRALGFRVFGGLGAGTPCSGFGLGNHKIVCYRSVTISLKKSRISIDHLKIF